MNGNARNLIMGGFKDIDASNAQDRSECASRGVQPDRMLDADPRLDL
jgi:hypothetical protein